jgi:hypothetical protein
MAVRTTATLVKQIIDTDLSDTIVDAYILAANYTITEVLGSDTELSSDHKAELERWLAAHLISATRERQASKEGAGGASITYEGTTGEGLKATMYGQQVLAMDATGKLAVYTGAKKAASVYAVTSFD